MNNGKIAVIGDKDSVLAFKAAGAEVFSVSTSPEARDAIKNAAKSFTLIFITEKLAADNADLISHYRTGVYPVIVPIPDSNGTTGFIIAGLKNDVEKALGVDIVFNKK